MRRTPPILLLLGVLAPGLASAQLGGRTGTVTPPRLAAVDGQASFWRPGSTDWTLARVNTPLGTGDALLTGVDTSAEVQFAPASYLRLGAATYVELSDVALDQLQLKISDGEASIDLRDLGVRVLEIDTPNAAFTIDRPGYYRLHVDKRGTTLIVRRGGGATLTPGNAAGTAVRTGEEAVVTSEGGVHRFAAPDLDAWDRWSTARTDRLVDTLSARYVADGIYGIDELDHAGTWRQVDAFGPVWIPDDVPPGWVPFGAGAWIYDSAYGWTWVDDVAWGWAPFHHGRWVSVDGRWAWAPGPPDVVPAYAPATVAWLEGGPGIAWVPLAWGEPIFPWWGPPGAVGVASWAGWGGPWMVNGAPIQQRIAIYASNMSYVNASVPGAVVATRADRFGRGGREQLRATADEVALMRPREAGPDVSPVAASLAPTTERAPKAASSLTQQRVVATRMPPDAGARLRTFGLKVPATAVVQLVLPPPRAMLSTGDRPPEAAGSPPFPGQPERASAGDTVRTRPPRAPGFIEWLRGAEASEAGRRVPRDLFASDRVFEPPIGEPYRTDLPGEPAMRLRPFGGTGGFAVTEKERREAPPPRPAPAPAPVVTASISTTSSTMVVPTTLVFSTTSLVTSTTFVTSTTLAPPPPIVSAPRDTDSFQTCSGIGAACGPCAPSGAMGMCLRQIGKVSPICALPNTCVGIPCLDDGECEAGERCVQNPTTQKANCCRECAGAVGEHVPRYVSLATTTTSWTIVVTSTTHALPPTTSTTLAPAEAEPGFQPCTAAGASCGPCAPSGEMSTCVRHIGDDSAVCPQPNSCIARSCLWDRDCGPGRRCVLNSTTYQTNCCDECTGVAAQGRPQYFAPSTTTTLAPVSERRFQLCAAVGATCGPCLPSGLMSVCLPHIGDERPICTQPDSCVEASCLLDRDCGTGRRCVVNPSDPAPALFARKRGTSCCEECHALGQDDLFDAAPPSQATTSTTLPPSSVGEPPFRRCLLAGDTCGPCGPTGLMTICQREIETGRMLCPKQGSCVEVSCREASDCVQNQRCVFNSITMRSNCCEVCE